MCTSRIYSHAVISFLKNFNRRSYISIPVSITFTSRIYSLAVISFLKTSTRAHIYLSPSLQSVLHVFTVSQWSLFLKPSTRAHIYLSPSLQSVLHVFTVSQWSLFLKLQPALIYIYPRLCNPCTSRIYSLAVISFLKTSTRAHIYLSPSLQSVLHVFTVSQWSLFLKLQPALIYIYPRLYNLYFTYLQSRSDLFS